MKTTFKVLTLTIAFGLFALHFTGCKKDDPAPNPNPNPTPNPTQVTGTAKLPVGTSGDLSNAKVSVYSTWDNWNNNSPIKFVAVQGSGATVTFTMPLNAGNYYLDVWKDADNSGTWSLGDFVGWYGSGGLGSPLLTEFQLAAEQTLSITIDMYLI